jgi:hypothetical protein
MGGGGALLLLPLSVAWIPLERRPALSGVALITYYQLISCYYTSCLLLVASS